MLKDIWQYISFFGLSIKTFEVILAVKFFITCLICEILKDELTLATHHLVL